KQSKEQLHRDGDGDVRERHPNRVHVSRVLREHLHEVLDTNELRRLQQIIVGEREVERGGHGAHDEDRKADKPRGDESITRAVLSGRSARARSLPWGDRSGCGHPYTSLACRIDVGSVTVRALPYHWA